MRYSSNFGCGDYLTQQGVTRLLHITSCKHLPKILEEGIKPYNPIFKEGFQPANSTYNQKRAHFTIQYPHPYIKEKSPVAVLISPRLADRHDASFTVTTSARKQVIVCIGRKEIEAVFADTVYLSNSEILLRHEDSPSNMPTSQMAEVRFSKLVSPNEFTEIVFPSSRAAREYENQYGRIPAEQPYIVDERLFAFSSALCSSNYHEWFRKFDDKRRIGPVRQHFRSETWPRS